MSRATLETSLAESGHLTAAPELIVECLSYGGNHEQRDRQLKLKLYSARGVQVYWIIDWMRELLAVYERQGIQLELRSTLRSGDVLESSLLPGFRFSIARLFEGQR